MPRFDPDAEDWRVVVQTDRATAVVMRGNRVQCRAVARSVVGMVVGDGALSLGRVTAAWTELVPVEVA